MLFRWSSIVGSIRCKANFNIIEQNNDFGLNMYDAHYPNLDPQIGRLWQIDARPNEMVSPYSAMMNNPIKFSVPLSDMAWVINKMEFTVAWLMTRLKIRCIK